MFPRCCGKCLVGTLDNTLRTNINPTPGRHLPIHRELHCFQTVKFVACCPVWHEVGVRDQHTGRMRKCPEYTASLARLNQERLVILQIAQSTDNCMKGFPAACRTAGTTVDDQFAGIFRDFLVQIVHQHAHRGFLVPTFARNRCATRGAYRCVRAHFFTALYLANSMKSISFIIRIISSMSFDSARSTETCAMFLRMYSYA